MLLRPSEATWKFLEGKQNRHNLEGPREIQTDRSPLLLEDSFHLWTTAYLNLGEHVKLSRCPSVNRRIFL